MNVTEHVTALTALMKLEPFLRLTARVWSLVCGALLFLFAFGGKENPPSLLGFLAFPGVFLAGYVIAWWRELAGGLFILAAYAFLTLYFRVPDRLSLGMFLLILAAPGFLYIASALTGSRKSQKTPPV